MSFLQILISLRILFQKTRITREPGYQPPIHCSLFTVYYLPSLLTLRHSCASRNLFSLPFTTNYSLPATASPSPPALQTLLLRARVFPGLWLFRIWNLDSLPLPRSLCGGKQRKRLHPPVPLLGLPPGNE